MRWFVVCVTLLAASCVWSEEAQETRQEKPLERVARFAVGKVLSFVLETETTVGSVRLDPDKQIVELNNLRIGNPKGFDAETVIALENVRVQADPKLLFSDEPVVSLIGVRGASVNAEANVSRGVNLKKLLDSASRFGEPKLLKLLPKKKWRIEKALIESCEVNIITQLLEKKTSTKKLERFEMSFLGKDGKGMTADQAMVKVLETLIEKIGLLEGSSLLPRIPLFETLTR